MTKEFTNLADLAASRGASYTGPKIQWGQCTALLPNHMQCYKPGAVQVVETTTLPATEEGSAAVDTQRVYQLCRGHAELEWQEYQKTLPPPAPVETAPAKPVDPTEPKTAA